MSIRMLRRPYHALQDDVNLCYSDALSTASLWKHLRDFPTPCYKDLPWAIPIAFPN
ncbi:hypothetical protein PILCRDRAFT_809891 [Piloderma croceum F 1598]|uniref:Uncharacterized protein n=1 Tax=Piloderma croceum (strain F 1598) TaxID=765440 RepID=A0A0C3BZC9_PILCF|nr:hypothetical protein PILCRDRAFT_809891 [Piloderma croceum F 1598]